MNKKLLIITLGRASQMLMMFLTYRILSKLFSVEEMGGYYFLLSIAGAYGLIFANPLGMYANRKIHDWKKNGILIKYLTNLTIAYFVGAIITIPFIFIFKDKLTSINLPFLSIIGILIFYIFSNTINTTFIPTLNLLGESLHFVAWTFFTSVFGLVFSYCFVKFFGLEPMYWLLGQSVAFIIFAILSFVILNRKFPNLNSSDKSDNSKNIRVILKFATPVAFTNIFVWSMAQSFRFFLKGNSDAIMFGEMTFGLGLASSLSVAVEYLFQQLFLPNFYQELGHEKESKERSWNLLLNKVAPSYLAYCFFLFGLSSFLIRVLADPKFKNAGIYLALGAFIEFFRMISNVFTMATHAEMKTEKAFIPYLFGGGFTLISILIITKNTNLFIYTPFVLALGYLISCLFLYLSIRKFFNISFNIKKFIQYGLVSIVFLIPNYILKQYSANLLPSILICFVFGLILLFLFYKQYKAENEQ